MKHHLEMTEHAKKQLKKLDLYVQKMILLWLDKNINGNEKPRIIGKALSADRAGQWRYRIGDYRVIVLIEDDKLVVLAIAVGHRKNIHEK